MFWDSKVCCFIWKRGVGHSILVGGPVNEVKHNFVIFVVTSFSFFSWCFFWNVFLFSSKCGPSKNARTNSIPSICGYYSSSLHLWCPAGLFPTWHLPNFIKSPQNWFALPVSTFPKWVIHMVIPCRNGLVTTQPLQHHRQEGQVKTRQSLSDWYLEQDEDVLCMMISWGFLCRILQFWWGFNDDLTKLAIHGIYPHKGMVALKMAILMKCPVCGQNAKRIWGRVSLMLKVCHLGRSEGITGPVHGFTHFSGSTLGSWFRPIWVRAETCWNHPMAGWTACVLPRSWNLHPLWKAHEPWQLRGLWVNTYHNTHCWTKFVKIWDNYDLTLKMMFISWGFNPLQQPCIYICKGHRVTMGLERDSPTALFFHETAPKSIERPKKHRCFASPKMRASGAYRPQTNPYRYLSIIYKIYRDIYI